MPVTFSELFRDEALEVRNRRDLKRLYDAAKAAVAENRLTLEGHSLPASLNAWITAVEGEGGAKLPKRDTDVVDFSFAADDKLNRWKASLAPEPPKPKRLLSLSAKELLESVQALERANTESLGMTNGKKDDLLAALSDLQGAVYSFLDAYDGVQADLKLPERELELANVQVRTPRKKASDA